MNNRKFKEYWSELEEQSFSSKRDAVIHRALATQYTYVSNINWAVAMIFLYGLLEIWQGRNELLGWDLLLIPALFIYFTMDSKKKRDKAREEYESLPENEKNL